MQIPPLLIPDVPAPNQPAPAIPAGPTPPVPNQPVPHWTVPNSKPASKCNLLWQPLKIIHQQVLNWSHFKPEFAGRPEEDAEAHLLCTP